MLNSCRKVLVLISGLIASQGVVQAQNVFKAIVIDSATQQKLSMVAVRLRNSNNGTLSDSAGMVIIKNVPDGVQRFEAGFPGYKKKTFSFSLPQAPGNVCVIIMAPLEQTAVEVIVTSTRTNSRIEDVPVKAEVLGAGDLEEESSLQPGNISSLLSDVSGVQIQQTSAVSGNSDIKMQGLDTRYTLLLRDGLPAFIGLSGGLNILQIPPLDLQQIEIIKGPTSTMNGAGAITGAINFVSKAPADSNEAAFVFNQSSLLETNFDAWFSGKKNNIGYTILAGGTHQFAVDVNHDGYSDVPQLLSFIIHPQLFFYPHPETQIRVGLWVNYENRLGGDMEVIKGEGDSAHQYFEKNISENYGAELLLNHQFSNGNELAFKSNANSFERDFSTNSSELNGIQWSAYSELYYTFKITRDNLMLGASYLFDRYQQLPRATGGYPNQTYHTPGIFIQNNYYIENKLNFQAGFRLDWQSAYGLFALPQAAVLYHATKGFSFRLNGGSGYVTPDLVDIASNNENIAAYIARSNLIEEEYSLGGTADWTYSKTFPARGLALYVNQTFFYTWVRNAIIEQYFSSGLDSVYSTRAATSLGVDNYIRISKNPVEAYLGYTFTYPRKTDEEQPFMTLTPLHRVAAVITSNVGKHFKLGLEGSLYGREYLDDGAKTVPYFLLSASVQYRINRRVLLVLNGENLLNVRQSRWGPIVQGPPASPVFAQIWEPTSGAVVNFSIMVRI